MLSRALCNNPLVLKHKVRRLDPKGSTRRRRLTTLSFPGRRRDPGAAWGALLEQASQEAGPRWRRCRVLVMKRTLCRMDGVPLKSPHSTPVGRQACIVRCHEILALYEIMKFV